MLLKLGVSLIGLNQRDVACANFAEIGKRYPSTSAALKERVEPGAGASLLLSCMTGTEPLPDLLFPDLSEPLSSSSAISGGSYFEPLCLLLARDAIRDWPSVLFALSNRRQTIGLAPGRGPKS